MSWKRASSKCGCCCAASEITELLHRSKFNAHTHTKKHEKYIICTHKKQQASHSYQANNQNKERWSLEVVTTTTKTTEYWKWEKQVMLHGFLSLSLSLVAIATASAAFIVLSCVCALFSLLFISFIFSISSVHTLFRSLVSYPSPAFATHTWFLRFVFSLKCFRFFSCLWVFCMRALCTFNPQCWDQPQKYFIWRKELNLCNTKQYIYEERETERLVTKEQYDVSRFHSVSLTYLDSTHFITWCLILKELSLSTDFHFIQIVCVCACAPLRWKRTHWSRLLQKSCTQFLQYQYSWHIYLSLYIFVSRHVSLDIFLENTIR